MSKNIREIAEQWGCDEDTVRRYCASGIIPVAEKIKRKWSIPDEWPKPPMTRHMLCFLLDTIYQLNHGADFRALKFGKRAEEIKAGYDYLISSGFMSSIDTTKLETDLVKAIVTPRGEALIKRENIENNKKSIHFKSHVMAKANVGVASVEGELEVSN